VTKSGAWPNKYRSAPVTIIKHHAKYTSHLSLNLKQLGKGAFKRPAALRANALFLAHLVEYINTSILQQTALSTDERRNVDIQVESAYYSSLRLHCVESETKAAVISVCHRIQCLNIIQTSMAGMYSVLFTIFVECMQCTSQSEECIPLEQVMGTSPIIPWETLSDTT